MAYCTVDDILKIVKEEMQESIFGNEEFENDDARMAKLKELIQEAIEDASYEIDGYLSKRYSLPFKEAPKVLYKLSKDIAVYNLMSRRGINEENQEKTLLTRYNAAVKFLDSVAKGVIDIGTVTTTTSASIGFKSKSNERLFTRSSMRGY